MTNVDETTSAHLMPHGAELRADGEVRFRLWAPAHDRIALALEADGSPRPMRALQDGWHELAVPRLRAGARYRFVLPDGTRVPDPASRFQPEDVHGPSEVIDARAYRWRDAAWRGRPWREAVVYELHLGTFTPDGTFAAAIEKLDALAELGVTAIEIMPIGDFAGRRNWGYDGVLPYAPDASYGRPEDFKRLVDAAHARGLMVILDVVYNHFGPEGNYLSQYAPEFFTSRHHNPWGDAINYDGDRSAAVRAFVVHNALYWIEEFHVDGLRLDAVHAIVDESRPHILEEIATRARAAAGERYLHLVLENEENESHWLRREPDGVPRGFSAQWNDDVHHVLHVAASGEETGYYADYRGDTDKLGRALAEGFAFQGEMMSYRGSARGEPSHDLPAEAFVAFVQNHDQVGNRAFGDRIGAFAPREAVRAIVSVVLLLPQIPMLFMGEEWAASTTFPFFCDFGPDLADAVRDGRREEFARFPEFADPRTRERIPDPQSDATFASAKLRWDERKAGEHGEMLAVYRALLQVRRETVIPLIPQIVRAGTFTTIGAQAVVVSWEAGERRLTLAANLSASSVDGFPGADGRIVWTEADARDDGRFGPWAIRWGLR